MATVYLADDRKHRRRVALKVLSPELAASLGPARFLREIEIAAGLAHPHILPLYDSGEASGFLYYAMPYVEGESLRDRLQRQRQLPLEEALQIGREVADALGYAHSRHVVHRDIKPENILVLAGHAVVSDFGIARAIDAAVGVVAAGAAGAGERLTGKGVMVGTPGYMSPEQVQGIEQLDGRSDLYSLGCVLYEMLAGDPPFTGWSAQAILARQMLEPVPRLRTVRETVPAWVEQAVARALARAPADRFATAAELVEALATPRTATAATAPPDAAPQPVAPPAGSIAVLPFVNLSADPENEYFSEGMTEEIINALTRVAALRVASRTASFAFKGAGQDIRVIGEKLQVRTLLEGSVRRAGEKLRITAQLINVADGYHLWSSTYERELRDVFAMQDEIARAIVGALRVKLVSHPVLTLVEPRTDNVEAYALYLKARYFWRRKSASGLKQCITYFEQALAADPAYSLAAAGLADSYTALGYYNYLPPRAAFPQAKAAADRALAIDSRLAEAHTARACVSLLYEWDWPGAERGFDRAIALAERYPTAHFWHTCYLWATGRTGEGVQEAVRAQALAPLSLVCNANLAWALYFDRRYAAAASQCQRTLELDPRYVLAHTVLGQVHAATSRYDAAIDAFQSAVNVSGGLPFAVAALGYAYARAGEGREAAAVLEKLSQRTAAEYVPPFCVALVHTGLGDVDQALHWLERACEERSHWLVYLKAWPLFDALRSDARFTSLLGRIRAP